MYQNMQRHWRPLNASLGGTIGVPVRTKTGLTNQSQCIEGLQQHLWEETVRLDNLYIWHDRLLRTVQTDLILAIKL